MAGTSQSAAAGGPGPPAQTARARLIAVGILGGLVVAFALLNLESVEVDWILGTWQTPLIVVILLTLAIGILLGIFIARRRFAAKAAREAAPGRGSS